MYNCQCFSVHLSQFILSQFNNTEIQKNNVFIGKIEKI